MIKIAAIAITLTKQTKRIYYLIIDAHCTGYMEILKFSKITYTLKNLNVLMLHSKPTLKSHSGSFMYSNSA